MKLNILDIQQGRQVVFVLQSNFSTTASSVKTSVTQKVNTVTNQNTATPTALSAAKLTSAPADFDASKITVAGFNKTGDKMAYCAQSKTTNKISCYLNDQILGNPYTFKPYWIGFSPDNQRVVFLYIDPSSKQYFTYENGVEGQRYDGPINAPKFSDDSKNFLYVVTGKDTKNFVVLNGTPYAAHDKIYGVPVFSSDGKYLLYGARDGQDFSWVADPIQ